MDISIQIDPFIGVNQAFAHAIQKLLYENYIVGIKNGLENIAFPMTIVVRKEVVMMFDLNQYQGVDIVSEVFSDPMAGISFTATVVCFDKTADEGVKDELLTWPGTIEYTVSFKGKMIAITKVAKEA